jgi:riboflavin biosynthesis pyrimidine reductase
MGSRARPFVYASFIMSLDGRISLPDPQTKARKAPGGITNPRDWRLFQELAASADVLVTSGRYMRDLAGGVAQAGLPVSSAPEFADLMDWRADEGLAPQPAVAIVSASLDLSIPVGLAAERAVYVVTGAAAGREKLGPLEARGARVLSGGDGLRVEGYRLVSALAREGFANIAMVGGAELLNTLLADNAVDRLYLTQAHRILGGLAYDTLLKGRALAPPADFALCSLCFDTSGEFGQSFGVYDRLEVGHR